MNFEFLNTHWRKDMWSVWLCCERRRLTEEASWWISFQEDSYHTGRRCLTCSCVAKSSSTIQVWWMHFLQHYLRWIGRTYKMNPFDSRKSWVHKVWNMSIRNTGWHCIDQSHWRRSWRDLRPGWSDFNITVFTPVDSWDFWDKIKIIK